MMGKLEPVPVSHGFNGAVQRFGELFPIRVMWIHKLHSSLVVFRRHNIRNFRIIKFSSWNQMKFTIMNDFMIEVLSFDTSACKIQRRFLDCTYAANTHCESVDWICLSLTGFTESRATGTWHDRQVTAKTGTH